MGNVVVLDHPLIQHKLGIIRDEKTGSDEFRKNVFEITSLMVYEVCKDFKTIYKLTKTPVGTLDTKMLTEEVVVVPILRAGLGMLEAICNFIPDVKVGHIGICRNEKTLKPSIYYLKLPNCLNNSTVLVLDPMLATAGSLIACIEKLKNEGAKRIKFIGLVGAPEGVKAVFDKYDDIDIYLASLDQHLNEKGYIVPGLGDCGDRLFGTE